VPTIGLSMNTPVSASAGGEVVGGHPPHRLFIMGCLSSMRNSASWWGMLSCGGWPQMARTVADR
jgi:hypothetical protein